MDPSGDALAVEAAREAESALAACATDDERWATFEEAVGQRFEAESALLRAHYAFKAMQGQLCPRVVLSDAEWLELRQRGASELVRRIRELAENAAA